MSISKEMYEMKDNMELENIRLLIDGVGGKKD